MSLIEVVVFIVILGIAIVGTLVLYNRVTEASVDPMVRKQALALASSMLEEVELRAFTFCDPDEPAVYTATAGCGSAPAHVEVLGPESFSPPGTEDRYSSTAPFDNVNDYNNFRMGAGQANPDIKTADGTIITSLASYSVVVSVANAGGDFGFAADEVLLITVTATHAPTSIAVTLQGYRFRYAPNSP
ncbi:hypothetical protein AYO46_06860 [Betaproteobacteria bacterium SCGC AG-212-J23]|nr:hypothetical protein AYO46_06860 [Betaproteobacteria bacterium SCGC AG-212-J23]